MATKNRKIRKYLKKRILPPLTKEDLMERPEVGTTLRNKLCAVIHNPAGFITEVSANLIFVLCKENGNLTKIKLNLITLIKLKLEHLN